MQAVVPGRYQVMCKPFVQSASSNRPMHVRMCVAYSTKLWRTINNPPNFYPPNNLPTARV